MTYYVCSYGGCGSHMVCDFLKNFGNVEHIHDRNPPKTLKKVFAERFTTEDCLDNVCVIFLYADPERSILSRASFGEIHWNNIGVRNPKEICYDRDSLMEEKLDLVGYVEFFKNYFYGDFDYNLLVVNFDKLWDSLNEFFLFCEIPLKYIEDFPKKDEARFFKKYIRRPKFSEIHKIADESDPVFLKKANPKLSICMATLDDFDGVFFTIQALRLYQNINIDHEFVVLDGNPSGRHGEACRKFLENVPNSVYVETDRQSSFTKYDTINHATGDYIIIIDCHVLLCPDFIKNLLGFFKKNPMCRDLIQGPLLYDDLKMESTNLNGVWSGGMYGQWEKTEGKCPFEIKAQGMGFCAFEKRFFPKINKFFRGFGGEEGYIAEKFREAGGRNICHPDLKWNHRFGRPNGIPFQLKMEDRIWNYLLGWMEIYQNEHHPFVSEIIDYFSKITNKELVLNILKDVKKCLK